MLYIFFSVSVYGLLPVQQFHMIQLKLIQAYSSFQNIRDIVQYTTVVEGLCVEMYINASWRIFVPVQAWQVVFT